MFACEAKDKYPWQNWCRLCAKEDASGGVHIHTSESGGFWNTVLKKYFSVQIRKNSNLSCWVCEECFNLITHLHSFSKHVATVQELVQTMRSNESNSRLDAATRRQLLALPVETNNVTKWPEPNAAPLELTIEKVESIDCFPDFPDYLCKKDCVRLAREKVSNLKLPTVDNKSCKRRKKGYVKKTYKYSFRKVKKSYVKQNYNRKSGLKANTEFIPNDSVEFNCVLVNPESTPIKAEICDGDEYNETQDNQINSIAELTDNDPLVADITEHTPNEQNNHHTDITQKPIKSVRYVKCEKCNKSLRSKASLRMHIIAMHDKDEMICNQCGKLCLDLESFNAHMAMHDAMRKYRCVACKSTFSRVTEYRTHLLAHVDLLPYCCKYCNSRFGSILNIKQHNRFMHGNEPPNKPFFHKIDIPSMHKLVKMVAQKAISDAQTSNTNEAILP